ncbi:hypothetical protein [Campylobacter gracilis]|uniref:Uncharacterized protein n=1 Tax=Campylobacter gracilis RM3268 TaxID=553220 RepID=C8PDY4_9BACT|nr:hypothetical protein [Campylobacter gracilis]AKT92738.1 hypothetical protein CGRAC_1295 [Campylobacter gracilis]EEV18857.1 hypothetical protein CAMGR0001_2334 [Campylobacter gracilis RM3268]UEB45084.1 hypothetical protein LK410_08805 [Campylobacter gracilis]SUW82254.1 Uncharacterised protein [Campylobacter gracilis]
MAFVTERISKEDVEKYDLLKPCNEICNKYYQGELDLVDLNSRDWCIDRDRGIWLFVVRSITIGDPRDMNYSGEDIWILHYKGKDIEIDLRNIHNEYTGKKDTDNPFILIYELESIRSDIGDIPKQEIVDILKEILNEYGDGGSIISKENIQVTFVSKI